MERQRLNDLLDLLLNQLELLTRPFAVQHPVPHRDRHPVHVFDLGNDLFGGPTKSDIATLVRQGAVTPTLEVLWGELPRRFDRFGDGATGHGTVIGDSHLVAVGIAEPESADVFDAVISETECYPVFLAVNRDRADRVLRYAGI